MNTKITNFLGMLKLKTEKNLPTICLVVGIASGIGAIACSVRAGLKVKDIVNEKEMLLYKLDEVKVDLDEGKEIHCNDGSEYSLEDYYLDVKKTKMNAVIDIAMVCAPAVILEALSISALIFGNTKLMQRNAALATYSSVITKSYNDYRERVRAVVGEEKENDIFNNIERHVETVEKEDPETGKKHKEKEEIVERKTIKNEHPFVFIFDPVHCDLNYTKSPEANYIFLKHQEKYADDLLTIKGYYTLAQVLESIGYKDIPAYAYTHGWIKHNNKNSSESDGHISFGLPNEKDIMYPEFWLNFNCDGFILDDIDDVIKTYRKAR